MKISNGGIPWAAYQGVVGDWAVAHDGRTVVVFPRPEVWGDRRPGELPGSIGNPKTRAFIDQIIAATPTGDAYPLKELLAFLGTDDLCEVCRPVGLRWCTRCVANPGLCGTCQGKKGGYRACGDCGHEHRCTTCEACRNTGECGSCDGTLYVPCHCDGSKRRLRVRICNAVFNTRYVRQACADADTEDALVSLELVLRQRDAEDGGAIEPQLWIYGVTWRAVVMAVDERAMDRSELQTLPTFPPLRAR